MSLKLLNDLIPSGVDHLEAIDVIIAHFGGGCSTSEFEVLVPGNSPHALRIRTKGDRIVEIYAESALRSEDRQDLCRAIRSKLVDSQARYIAACICFSSQPVSGSFRCIEPELQILGAPDDAPRPPYVVGDHPFIVEFPCTRSSDFMLTWKRRTTQHKRWSNVLNVLLAARIFPLSYRARWAWTLPDPSNFKDIRFAQHYYSIPDFQSERDAFSDDVGPIPFVGHNEYYTAHVGAYGADFALPESLGTTLNRITRLEIGARQKFLRAAHWYSAADAIWQDSASAAFISSIAAIESLMPRQSGANCHVCGKPSGPGPTKLFRTFLETYVPDVERMRKVARSLYDARSKLAHGDCILLSDSDPIGRFDSESLREFHLSQDLYQTVRVAIINWLYAQPFE